MEKALGTRLIVCCVEVLPLRQIPFFFCLLSNAFPDFGSVGRKRKKAKKKKKKMEKSRNGGLVPQYNLTVLQGKLTMGSNYV